MSKTLTYNSANFKNTVPVLREYLTAEYPATRTNFFVTGYEVRSEPYIQEGKLNCLSSWLRGTWYAVNVAYKRGSCLNGWLRGA